MAAAILYSRPPFVSLTRKIFIIIKAVSYLTTTFSFLCSISILFHFYMPLRAFKCYLLSSSSSFGFLYLFRLYVCTDDLCSYRAKQFIDVFAWFSRYQHVLSADWLGICMCFLFIDCPKGLSISFVSSNYHRYISCHLLKFFDPFDNSFKRYHVSNIINQNSSFRIFVINRC